MGRNKKSRQNTLYQQGFRGRQSKHLPHHLTLDNFPVAQEEQLKTLLAETAVRPAFPVTFSHAGVFPEAKVLFAAPDCSRELLALKEVFGPSRGWTPHATMLIDEPEAVYRALPVLMEHFLPFDGTVARLYLYEFFPVRHILTVPLLYAAK